MGGGFAVSYSDPRISINPAEVREASHHSNRFIGLILGTLGPQNRSPPPLLQGRQILRDNYHLWNCPFKVELFCKLAGKFGINFKSP